MKIVGIDRVFVGVEEMDDAQRFLRDFGLSEFERGANGATFTAQDGSDIVLRNSTDAGLPLAVGSQVNARQIIWGVSDKTELEKIGAELSRDRQVQMSPDGVLYTYDDTGFSLAFQVSKRHAFDAAPVLLNVYGQPPQRRDRRIDFKAPIRPRSMGHIVLFVPDLAKAKRFYMERLGFRETDAFRDRSVFLRAAGSNDHHNLFLIQRKDMPGGLHHMEFHVADYNEVMVGGSRLVQKGWQTYSGPGRHVLGSNYFWYFKTPLGGALELAADMDFVTDDWVAGEWDYVPDMVAAWSTSYTVYGH